MYIKLNEKNMVIEIITNENPELPGVNINDRYPHEFVAVLLWFADDTVVEPNDIYNPETGLFNKPELDPDTEPKPMAEPEPTPMDIIEAQVTYTAMMTDTLLEA